MNEQEIIPKGIYVVCQFAEDSKLNSSDCKDNILSIICYDNKFHLIKIYEKENSALFTFGDECGHTYYGIDELLKVGHIKDCLQEILQVAGNVNFLEYQPVQTADPLPDKFRSVGKTSSFHEAVIKDDVSYLKIFLCENPDGVHSKDEFGRTPVHMACIFRSKNSLVIMRILLQYRPNIFARDRFGSTAFMYATKNNRKDLVQMLIDFKSEIIIARDIVNYNSALHVAVSQGHMEIVKILLENGSSTLQENSNCQSSVDIALDYKDLEMVDLLVKSLSLRRKSAKSEWFHGHIGQKTATELILREAEKLKKSSGVFLVRYSKKASRKRIISLLVGYNNVCHYLIMCEVS